MDDKNYLLEAVQKLTQPHKTQVMQVHELSGIQCISEVKHRPLLVLLRESVAGGTAGHAPTSQSREKIPLNPGALELWDSIVRQVNAWYLALGLPVEHEYITSRLSQWYRDFDNRRVAGLVSPEVEHDMERLVTSWAHQIEGMFDPPTTRELVDMECPVCGIAWPIIITNSGVENPRTGRRWHESERVVALMVYYRPDGHGGLQSSYAACRCCGETWNGSSGVRALAYELEHREIFTDLEAAAASGELDGLMARDGVAQ